MKDLTERQFENKLTKLGFKKWPLGYWKCPSGIGIFALNGGPIRRYQIEYLIAENLNYVASYNG